MNVEERNSRTVAFYQDADHHVLPGGCCGELLGIVQGSRNDSEILVCSQKRLCLIGVADVGGDGVPLL